MTRHGDPLDTYASNSDYWVKIIREQLDRYRTDLTDRAVLGELGDVRGLRVLDGGCGEGYMSRLVAKEGASEVVGIDTSASLVQAAATHPDTQSFPLAYRVASLEAIPEDDATFDAVVCNHVLSDVKDPGTALQEIGRVLGPGGRFVALMLHPCFYTAHSERDASGNIPVRSYFRERHVDQTFMVADIESPDEVHMNFRSLEFYARAILGAGFAITGLSEPHPSEAELDGDEWWRENFVKPLFLLLSGVKR